MNFTGQHVQGNFVQSSRGSERFRERSKREPRRNVIHRGKLAPFALPDHWIPEFLISPSPRACETRSRTRFRTPYSLLVDARRYRHWSNQKYEPAYADLSQVPNRLSHASRHP